MEYTVKTAKAYLPFSIPQNTVENMIANFLKSLEASFEDEEYLKSIAGTGSFARPSTAYSLSISTGDEDDEDDDETDEEFRREVHAFALDRSALEETFNEIQYKLVKKLLQFFVGLDWSPIS